jgi:phospholipase A1
MKISLLPVLLMAIGCVHAQTATDCRDITDEVERLACYDNKNRSNKAETPAPDPWSSINSSSKETRKSLLNQRWELNEDKERFLLRPYKPVYFFPVFYSSKLNRLPQTTNPRTTATEPFNLDHLESKFQLSFKTKLAHNLIGHNGDLWLGYTQTSRWQIYNSQESRPFRETNHEPEFVFTWKTDYSMLGFAGRMLSLSLNHQSNGQNEPISRSWNRVILTVGLDRPDWALLFRPWWRIPETSDEEDENPNIMDYVGRAEFLLVHLKGNTHQIATRIRHSLRGGEDNRGSVELNWSYPCFDRLRCHAQIFRGYGESLIDYNHSTTSIGLGVNLLDWF